MYQLRKF